MQRRALLPLVGSLALYASRLVADDHLLLPAANTVTLLSIPIEVQGAWPGSLPNAALTVVTRMREACLTGVRLISDRQPDRLRVDDHTAGPPAVWLHFDGIKMAWVIVDIGPSDWSKLAYQFGHELGHVLSNSWGPDAQPRNPCQWLEEALVESFSIRGLGLLAASWSANPPFPGDSAFGAAIGEYRANLLADYGTAATQQGATASLSAWFRTRRGSLELDGGVVGAARESVPTIVGELTADPACIEAFGALNRWPERTGVPFEDYLQRWERSCAELGASPRLPIRLRHLLLGA